MRWSWRSRGSRVCRVPKAFFLLPPPRRVSQMSGTAHPLSAGRVGVCPTACVTHVRQLFPPALFALLVWMPCFLGCPPSVPFSPQIGRRDSRDPSTTTTPDPLIWVDDAGRQVDWQPAMHVGPLSPTTRTGSKRQTRRKNPGATLQPPRGNRHTHTPRSICAYLTRCPTTHVASTHDPSVIISYLSGPDNTYHHAGPPMPCQGDIAIPDGWGF